MNHKSAPLISIIVAVFNGETTFQQCIDSIEQQTYLNKELIVIDGGSTDGTVGLIKENDSHLNYWISEPDRGIYNAWNKGLAQAKGEWICFLGADDYFWEDTVLERMVPQLTMFPVSIRVAYGQIALVDANGEVIRKEGEPWEFAKKRFNQFMCIPHVGTMHRCELFERHGKFDETFRIAGDYELLLRELKTGDAAFIPNIITAGQRLGGISTDTTYYLLSLQETWRAQRMNGKLLPSKYLINKIAIEYFRRLLWMVCGEKLAKKLLDLRRRSKGLPPHWAEK
jgi:glycosyltransferase involved in cell wall biosynthesis